MTRPRSFRTAARSTVLVLGPPRCGTTMVTSLIGGHPEMGISSEDLRLTFTRISGKQVVGNKLCIPGQIQFDRRGTLARKSARAVLAKALGSRRARRLGILQPESHYSIVDYLALPDLHVIGIVRDSESMIRSAIVRAGDSAKTALHIWESAMLTMDRVSQDGRFRWASVEYERVVDDPERAARALCAFLGVRFDQSMIDRANFNPIYPGRSGIARTATHAVEVDLPRPSNEAQIAYQRLQATSLT